MFRSVLNGLTIELYSKIFVIKSIIRLKLPTESIIFAIDIFVLPKL